MDCIVIGVYSSMAASVWWIWNYGWCSSAVGSSCIQSQMADACHRRYWSNGRRSGECFSVVSNKWSVFISKWMNRLQNDIFEWSRDHRVHHKFSETNADPHNAKRGFFFAHVGWLLCKKHPEVKRRGATVDVSDLLADPIVRFQRQWVTVFD